MWRILLLFLMLAIPTWIRAQEASPGPGIVDDDLFEGLRPAVEKAPAASEETGEGEDIQFGSADPLSQLAKKMRKSETSIAGGDLSSDTHELQDEILSELDKLLNETKKNCKGGNCNKPGSGSSSSSASSSKSGAPKPGTTKPTGQSTNRVGKAGGTETDDVDAAESMKSVWGHLPPRLREAMQSASLEQFLPKYERLIGEFYKRLAETDPQ